MPTIVILFIALIEIGGERACTMNYVYIPEYADY